MQAVTSRSYAPSETGTKPSQETAQAARAASRALANRQQSENDTALKAAERARSERPTTNTQGQTIGSRLNVTA